MGRCVLVPEVGVGWRNRDRYVGKDSVRMEFQRDVLRMTLTTNTRAYRVGYGGTGWKVAVAHRLHVERGSSVVGCHGCWAVQYLHSGACDGAATAVQQRCSQKRMRKLPSQCWMHWRLKGEKVQKNIYEDV